MLFRSPPELEYMGVSEGTMNSTFHGGIPVYNVTVPYDVEEVTVDILAKPGVSTAKLLGGVSNGVPTDASGYAEDVFTLAPGENKVATVLLYDVREIPVGGYPYYIGIYSMVIHRVTKNGIEMEPGDRTTTAADGTEATLKALVVNESKGGKEIAFTTGGLHDFKFNVYNYYVYTKPDAQSVYLTATAAHKDGVVSVRTTATSLTPDSDGGWIVPLEADGMTRVVITVTDPANNTSKDYTVMVFRGEDNEDRWQNYPRGIIRSVSVTGDTSQPTVPSQPMSDPFRAGTVTLTPTADDEITVQVRALKSQIILSYTAGSQPLTIKETTVRVNGHKAELVGDESNMIGIYEVTLPMKTFEERLDIWVDYPTGSDAKPDGTEAALNVQTVAYVLYVYHNDAPTQPKLDKDGNPERDPVTGELLYYTSAEAAADPSKYLTGPQLGQIMLDQTASNVDSGTFTTMFRGDVFYYRATAENNAFTVFASVLPKKTADQLVAMDQNGVAAQADIAALAMNQLTTSNTYIEVYDEEGYRYTIDRKSVV